MRNEYKGHTLWNWLRIFSYSFPPCHLSTDFIIWKLFISVWMVSVCVELDKQQIFENKFWGLHSNLLNEIRKWSRRMSHYSLQWTTCRAEKNIFPKSTVTETNWKLKEVHPYLQCCSVESIKSIDICSIFQQKQHSRQVPLGRGSAKLVSCWPFSHSCKEYKENMIQGFCLTFWKNVWSKMGAELRCLLWHLPPTLTSQMGFTYSFNSDTVKIT